MNKINENKIFYFNEMEEFFGSDEWKLEINIMDIWNQVSKGEITFEQFNRQYSQRLIQYKDQILELNNETWNSLVPFINELNTKKTKEESFDVYDNLYDIADKYDILIKTK